MLWGSLSWGSFAGVSVTARELYYLINFYKELCMETLTVHAPSPSTNFASYGQWCIFSSAPHVHVLDLFSRLFYSFSRVQTCGLGL